MSNYGYHTIQTSSAKIAGSKYPNRIKKARKIKMSIRQRIRNWLFNEVEQDIPQVVETDRLSSEGMRLQIYKASGGYIIETRTYDQRKDRSEYHMYIVTDDKNLGNEIGKIITLESLR